MDSAAPSAEAPAPSTAQQYDRDRLVVLATPENQSSAAALEAWGLEVLVASGGADALLAIQRTLPRVAVLGADLPGINGQQLCEVIKRNESLRGIKVILVAADAEALPGLTGAQGFGPDACRSAPDLLDGLHELMREFGLPVRVGAAAPQAGSEAAHESLPPSSDGLDEERAKAERLARVVISDIVLYQGEAFDRSNGAGTLVEDFQVELGEGRRLFSERIDERIRAERDHLVEELMRVAEDRRKD
jgi:CheY-like chemotaxis protein